MKADEQFEDILKVSEKKHITFLTIATHSQILERDVNPCLGFHQPAFIERERNDGSDHEKCLINFIDLEVSTTHCTTP